MSAYINPKYTAPGVQNPSPWQKALATTKQDTGANQLPGGFNPWQNYSDPASNSGWNYTGDQYFNAAADRPNWDLAQTGAKSETDRARVWRWTLDQLKAQGLDPGSAPQATVQAAYLANIARLKRDYQANGMDWAGSAYSGYDQFLGGGGQPGVSGLGGFTPTPTVDYGYGGQTSPATQPGGARAGNAGGWTYTANPGGMMDEPGGGTSTQGGGTVDPSAGRGSVPPQASGTNAIPGTSAPGGGVPTPGNPGAGSFPNFGQLGNVDPTYAFNLMQQDPGIAAHYLRLAAGQGGPVTGRLGQFKDSLYGRALQAFLALGGVGGNKGGFGGAQDFLGALNGGDLQGLLNGAASNAAGANFTGQDDALTEKILRAAIALKSLGTGTLGSSLMSGNLDNLLYQQEGAGIQDNGGASQIGGGLGRLAQGGSPYGAALQQYLALR